MLLVAHERGSLSSLRGQETQAQRGGSLPRSEIKGGCEFRSGWSQPPSPVHRSPPYFTHQNSPTLAHSSYKTQCWTPLALQGEEGHQHARLPQVPPFTVTGTKRMAEAGGSVSMLRSDSTVAWTSVQFSSCVSSTANVRMLC